MAEPTPMYLIAELDVRDPAKLLEYGRRVQPLMAERGGEILGASLAGAEAREGDWAPGLLILHRWRSREDFEAFWNSDEYAPIRELRHQACDARIVTFDSDPPRFDPER